MSERTSIAWTDATWNPVTGCTKVSEGCRYCYAERMAGRLWGERAFSDVRCHEDRLDQPLRWRKPRRVFVCSMGDLFHDDVPDAFIASVFNVIRACQAGRCGHIFQILTKRPDRMLSVMRGLRFNHDGAGRVWVAETDEASGYPLGYQHRGATGLTNVWLGVSCENQETADARIPLLLQTPAAVRFVSAEPLLGPLDLRCYLDGHEDHGTPFEGAPHVGGCVGWTPPLDWVIVGGESGPKARECRIPWIESVILQGYAAEVPVFVKQLGAYPVWVGAESPPIASACGKCGMPEAWPAALRVRQWPDTEGIA